MVTNVLGVRCTPPVKGLGVTNTASDRCVLMLLMYVCCCCLGSKHMYSRGSVRGWRAIYENQYKNVGFSMSPTRLGEAESKPLFFRAISAMFNAPSTATVLGRDPDMRHRNVPTAPLLAPQPKAREKNLGRRRAACLKTKCILYVDFLRHIKSVMRHRP